MRLTTSVGPDGDHWWTIVRVPGDGREVARGTRGYPGADACARAADQAMAAGPDARRPVEQPDGAWRWVISGPDGTPLAESPDVFPNAAFCGYALYEVRHAMHRAAATP